MSATELAKLVDKKGQWVYAPTKNGPKIYFEVIIKDAKSQFGRIDLLIRPIAGKGETWVSLDSVVIPRQRKADTQVKREGK